MLEGRSRAGGAAGRCGVCGAHWGRGVANGAVWGCWGAVIDCRNEAHTPEGPPEEGRSAPASTSHPVYAFRIKCLQRCAPWRL